MSKFKSHLFISVGETKAIFTLHKTVLHVYYLGIKKCFEVRSEYITNLSTDPDIAYSKASIYAQNNELELKTTRESLHDSLRDIKRTSRVSSPQPGKKVDPGVSTAVVDVTTARESIRKGIYPFGKYLGQPFHAASPVYITWLIKSEKTLEDGILKELAIAVSTHCKHMALPDQDESSFYGAPGDGISVDVTVVDQFKFDKKEAQGKRIVFITTMVTSENVVLVSKSRYFAPAIGEKMTIKGVVKSHDTYQGRAQTVIESISKV